MGLSRDESPVVHETETESVWLSLNKCSTLEACKALGLDTREVYRPGYEKSTQALVLQLDPQCLHRILQPIVISHTAASGLYSIQMPPQNL